MFSPTRPRMGTDEWDGINGIRGENTSVYTRTKSRRPIYIPHSQRPILQTQTRIPDTSHCLRVSNAVPSLPACAGHDADFIIVVQLCEGSRGFGVGGVPVSDCSFLIWDGCVLLVFEFVIWLSLYHVVWGG